MKGLSRIIIYKNQQPLFYQYKSKGIDTIPVIHILTLLVYKPIKRYIYDR